jgi:hypothetical protein
MTSLPFNSIGNFKRKKSMGEVLGDINKGESDEKLMV